MNFISSFQKQSVVLFLQFRDVAERLVQDHVLALHRSRYTTVECVSRAQRGEEGRTRSHLLERLGTGQKIPNAVNPSINLLLPVPLHCEHETLGCDTGLSASEQPNTTFTRSEVELTCIVRFLVFLPSAKCHNLNDSLTQHATCLSAESVKHAHASLLTWAGDQVSEFWSSLASCRHSCLMRCYESTHLPAAPPHIPSMNVLERKQRTLAERMRL